jgi:aspartyl-tRNA(Asn)/glutamyl-tRNA(Gln) amidotransferase subunit C
MTVTRMTAEITDDLVRYIARLSRLSLSEEELRGAAEHFRNVLGFVAELEALDLTGVDPSLFSIEATRSARPDEITPSLSVDAALSNAPSRKDAWFAVPKVVADATGGSS